MNACDAIGARLCSEDEWQLACELEPSATTTQDTGPDGLAFVEAENFTVGLRLAREEAVALWKETHENLWVEEGGKR